MRFVIGIDEAGRGPLAGPVSVGAIAMPASLNEWGHWEGLRDSKKLSESMREAWYERIKQDTRIRSGVSASGAHTIDVRGIVRAAHEAAARAAAKLELLEEECEAMLDHGLVLPSTYAQEQFVRGDETIPVIALASIVAKVERDRYMVSLASEHPLYGFERHKGYGTKQHQEAIRIHGPIAGIHRTLFIRSLVQKS